VTVNVRMRTNVLCQTLYEQDEITSLGETSARQLAQRLFYWEVLEFRRKYPFLIPNAWTLSPELTPRQRAEKDAFLPLPGAKRSTGWKWRQELTPMSPHQGIVPFFRQDQAPSRPPAQAAPPIPSSPAGPAAPPPRRAPVDEQAQIIDAPLNARLLVLAPPGTGKTETLKRRLCAMINAGAIRSPSQEIVVLSFTRSAVEEVRRRILDGVRAGLQDNLRYVQVLTFDSFTTRLLLLDLSLEELPREGYDQRISEFTRRLLSGKLPAAEEAVERIRYLLVDEVQDMVGPRAEMVLELARRVVARSGGVIFLGDPAQAIYDWQQRDRRGLSSAEFLARAREVLGDGQKEVELVSYHRYTAETREWVMAARHAMGKDGQSPDGAALHGLLRRLPDTCLDDVTRLVKDGKRTAILTRTNLEAFQIGDQLRRQGVRHTVWKGSSGDYWPGWLARLTFEFRMNRMSLEMARTRWKQLVGERERLAFDEATEFLQGHGLLTQGYIDLTDMARRVREATPRQLGVQSQPGGLIVSTIHRSKGLEFDRVLVLKPRSDISGQSEENRILYVAATRARQELRLLDREAKILRQGSLQLYDETLEHFCLRERKKAWLLLDGLEEIDLESLAQLPSGPGSVGGAQLQETLWHAFAGRPGETDAAILPDGSCVLLLSVSDEGQVESRPLCRLALPTGDDLRAIGRAFRKCVTRLTAVPVADLATVAFPWEQRVSTEFLGSARLALAPVLYGLAAVHMN